MALHPSLPGSPYSVLISAVGLRRGINVDVGAASQAYCFVYKDQAGFEQCTGHLCDVVASFTDYQGALP